MSELQITGRILSIGETEQVSDKFSKRTFILDITEGTFEKKVALQMTQQKCAILDGYQVGQTVTASINLESREHNGKWYTNATCWMLKAATTPQPEAPKTSGNYDPGSVESKGYYNPSPENVDDLPF